jgi:arylsulfatase A-like enzyme
VGLSPCDSGETGLSSLHEELVHIPCIVRLPDRTGAADRSQALAQPADLAYTMAQWFQLPSDQLAPWGRSWLPLVQGQQALRDRACLRAVDSGEQAIRTSAWHLILSAGNASPSDKLYAKPDDRWEANEVADRCLEVVDSLKSARDEFVQASHRGEPFAVPPLAEMLASVEV